MNNLLTNTNLTEALSWTLIHSIWQIGLIGVLIYLFIMMLPRLSSNQKYSTHMLGLIGILVTSLITFFQYFEYNTTSSFQVINEKILVVNQSVEAISEIGFLETVIDQINVYNNWIILIWAIGFSLVLIRFLFSSLWTIQLVNTAIKIDQDAIEDLLINIKSSFGIHKSIRVKWTNQLTSPAVVGFIQPIVLFPLASINQLTIEETKTILTHELAHIKRNDFLFNILQSFIEILFYFHPITWWISNQARIEREHSCDDLVLTMEQSPLQYAKLLVKMEELQQQSFLTLAFSNNKNQLTNRISRIIQPSKNNNTMKERIITMTLLCFMFIGISYAGIWNQEPIINPNTNAEIAATLLDTVPKKEIKVMTKTIERSEEVDEDGNVSVIVKTIIIDEDGNEKVNEWESTAKEDLKVIELDDQESGDVFIIKKRKKGNNEIEIEVESIINNHNDVIGNEEIKIIKFNGDDMIIPHGISSEDVKILTKRIKVDNQDELKNMIIEIDGKIIDLKEHINGNINHELLQNIEKDVLLELHSNELINEDHFIIDKIEKGSFPHVIHDMDFTFPSQRTPSTTIVDELYQDGLFEDGTENKMKLSGKKLKVNGKTQNKSVWKKYMKLYEKQFGSPLSKSSKIEIEDHRD